MLQNNSCYIWFFSRKGRLITLYDHTVVSIDYDSNSGLASLDFVPYGHNCAKPEYQMELKKAKISKKKKVELG